MIGNLCPELMNGFIVVGGRKDLAHSLEEQTRKHSILNPKHKYTQLLIHHFAEKITKE